MREHRRRSSTQALYRYNAAVDPADPFHNWGGNLWNQTWEGQWLAASRDGKTFEQFWNSLQGNGGQSLILATPYPFTTADNTGRRGGAANGGRGPADQARHPPQVTGRASGQAAARATSCSVTTTPSCLRPTSLAT